VNDNEASDMLQARISEWRQRGYVTFDELNDALPAHAIDSFEIERAMQRLTAAGIEVREPFDRPGLNER
jgi:hypothetical protein